MHSESGRVVARPKYDIYIYIYKYIYVYDIINVMFPAHFTFNNKIMFNFHNKHLFIYINICELLSIHLLSIRYLI